MFRSHLYSLAVFTAQRLHHTIAHQLYNNATKPEGSRQENIKLQFDQGAQHVFFFFLFDEFPLYAFVTLVVSYFLLKEYHV